MNYRFDRIGLVQRFAAWRTARLFKQYVTSKLKLFSFKLIIVSKQDLRAGDMTAVRGII
jgi:hypothetical protein